MGFLRRARPGCRRRLPAGLSRQADPLSWSAALIRRAGPPRRRAAVSTTRRRAPSAEAAPRHRQPTSVGRRPAQATRNRRMPTSVGRRPGQATRTRRMPTSVGRRPAQGHPEPPYADQCRKTTRRDSRPRDHRLPTSVGRRPGGNRPATPSADQCRKTTRLTPPGATVSRPVSEDDPAGNRPAKPPSCRPVSEDDPAKPPETAVCRPVSEDDPAKPPEPANADQCRKTTRPSHPQPPPGATIRSRHPTEGGRQGSAQRAQPTRTGSGCSSMPNRDRTPSRTSAARANRSAVRASPRLVSANVCLVDKLATAVP